MSRSTVVVVVFSALCLTSGALVLSVCEGWSLIDSLYYATTTVSSVGFGDIVASTVPGKCVTVALAFTGMGVFADLVSTTGQRIKEIGKLDAIIHECALCIAVGVALFTLVEGLPVMKSLYFVLIMSTTIGFGDIVPVTDAGKLCYVLYSLWALHAAAQMVALVKESLYERITNFCSSSTSVPLSQDGNKDRSIKRDRSKKRNKSKRN
jgi:hypothetical protein